ncbi:uncharacterized protein TNCV_4413281 [Trichonephila clavipes]|nr:uncharacterized protein TNCV_4413281 [Trichonephila clavipes]
MRFSEGPKSIEMCASPADILECLELTKQDLADDPLLVLNFFETVRHHGPGLALLANEAAVAEWYRYRIVACLVTSSSPVPLKTGRVGQRCTLNLSRAETSSRWCGVVVKEGQLKYRPRHLTMVQNYVVRRQKPSCS